MAAIDPLDVPLVDTDLLAELELTTVLIMAANDSSDRLHPDAIDRLLGIHRD